MQKMAYRLAEYQIFENQPGDLWWETHVGLGSSRSGKCFIKGDILFLKPGDSTGPGFLKGEFLDHLNKLPKWGKTKYYCASYKIYKCKSGSRKSFIQGWDGCLQDEVILKKGSTQTETAETGRKSVRAGTTEHVLYKLHRYEITKVNNGRLFWKSHGSLGTLIKGRCHIKSGILFLGPGETEQSGLLKREFIQQLIRLPDWEGTKYFCTSHTIYYVNTGAICRSLEEEKDLNGPKNIVANHKPYGAGIKFKPIIVNRGDTKVNLESFNLFKTLVMLTLKLFFGCFQIVDKVFRIFIDSWSRLRD